MPISYYKPTEAAVQLKDEVYAVIERQLPAGFSNIMVTNQRFTLGGEFIKIIVSAGYTGETINDVHGQYPHAISLLLDVKTLELSVQAYELNGGSRLKLKPKEGSYLAYDKVFVPFRKPKKVKKNVYSAIEKFIQRYIKLSHENYHRLTHTNMYTECASELFSTGEFTK